MRFKSLPSPALSSLRRWWRRGRLRSQRHAAQWRREFPWGASLAASAVVLIVAAGTWAVDRTVRDRYDRDVRLSVLDRASTARARLEAVIRAHNNLSQGLAAATAFHLSQTGHLRPDEYTRLVHAFMAGQPGVRAIALLQGHTVQALEPKTTSVIKVGFDFGELARQRQAINLARHTRQVSLSGPIALQDAEPVVLSYAPIFLVPSTVSPQAKTWETTAPAPVVATLPSGIDGYGGTIALATNMNFVTQAAGLFQGRDGLQYALRAKRSAQAWGEVFWGNPTLFEQQPVRLTVTFSNAVWELAAVPRDGWAVRPSSTLLLFRGLGVTLAIVGGGLVFLMVREPARLKAAIQQASDTNALLRAEVVERKQAQTQLRVLTAELEQRVRDRTQDLSAALDTLQKTQVQLVQTEKMSSLGQLVAGVAHEINNPVNFICGNLSPARDYIQDLLVCLQRYRETFPDVPPELAEFCDDIDIEFVIEDLPKLVNSMQVGADRIRQIVRSLRVFSRVDDTALKTVDLHEGIDSTIMILGNRLKAQHQRPAIQVMRRYGSLPKVECYAGQVDQIFMNLLVNAIDALDDSMAGDPPGDSSRWEPTITITTEAIDPGWIRATVADNGPGIPESVRDRLFEAFFTTKPVGKGTGMGLSISYDIATTKHGGRLTCESTPSEGTRFIVELPVSQTRVAQPAASTATTVETLAEFG